MLIIGGHSAHEVGCVFFPLNVSRVAATAPGAVMYFQSKGLVEDSEYPNSKNGGEKEDMLSLLEMTSFTGSLAAPSKAGRRLA